MPSVCGRRLSDERDIRAARVPASTIKAGDKVWVHNAFRPVASNVYEEGRGWFIQLEPLYEGDQAYATVQQGGAFMLREPRADERDEFEAVARSLMQALERIEDDVALGITPNVAFIERTTSSALADARRRLRGDDG